MSNEKIGLHNLAPAPGSHRNRKRLGRGPGSGTGKTSGKGHKGIKARAGHHGHGGNKTFQHIFLLKLSGSIMPQ